MLNVKFDSRRLDLLPYRHEAAIPLVGKYLGNRAIHSLKDLYLLGEKTKGEDILYEIGLSKTHDAEPVLTRQLFQRRLGKELYVCKVIGAALNRRTSIAK